MPKRHYICTLVGDGLTPATAFTPIGIPANVPWSATDGRSDPTVVAGKMFVEADVTDAQHTAIIGVAGVTYVPFENATGTPLTDSDSVATASAANITNIRTILENHHIPIDDLADGDLVQIFKRRIKRRLLIRQILSGDDFKTGLDTLVSALTAAQRQNIRNKLLAFGIDTTGIGIVGTDTIRQALRKIIIANSNLFNGV